MTGAVAFAFAFGVLAPLAPGGIAWALAAIGLSAATAAGRPVGTRTALGRGARSSTLAGLAFAGVLLAAAGVEELGLEVSDSLELPSFVLSIALALVGLGIALRFRRTTAPYGAMPHLILAVAYAVVSMPGVLGILRRLLERSAEGGLGLVIGAGVLVLAGAVTAWALVGLLGTAGALAARRAPTIARLGGGALAVAGGLIAAAYWLPGERGDEDEPGSELGETLAGASQGLGEILTQILVVPALLFLALAVLALVSSLRQPENHRA